MATQYIMMRSVGEEMEVIEAECLYTVDTKLVLFKLGCYKFKIPIVITKITIKKITKKYIEKKRRGNQNGTL